MSYISCVCSNKIRKACLPLCIPKFGNLECFLTNIVITI